MYVLLIFFQLVTHTHLFEGEERPVFLSCVKASTDFFRHETSHVNCRDLFLEDLNWLFLETTKSTSRILHVQSFNRRIPNSRLAGRRRGRWTRRSKVMHHVFSNLSWFSVDLSYGEFWACQVLNLKQTNWSKELLGQGCSVLLWTLFFNPLDRALKAQQAVCLKWKLHWSTVVIGDCTVLRCILSGQPYVWSTKYDTQSIDWMNCRYVVASGVLGFYGGIVWLGIITVGTPSSSRSGTMQREGTCFSITDVQKCWNRSNWKPTKNMFQH